MCGQTTDFVLAKLTQTVSFTKHSLNPPKVGNTERESLAKPIFEACNNSKRNNK